MTECFVYYRIAAGREAAARHALRATLREVGLRMGITGRPFVKYGEPLLWMEVYPPVADPDALVALLDLLAHEHGLVPCLADGARRHVERFVPHDLQPSRP